MIYEITPQTAPDDPATKRRSSTQLRADLDQAIAGTGLRGLRRRPAPPPSSTSPTLVKQYLPIVIGAVVLGAFILLVLVFRSILVPLKAAIMNLISIAAAYGVVVAVFQWGWASGARRALRARSRSCRSCRW